MPDAHSNPTQRSPFRRIPPSIQISVGLALGVLLGWAFPALARYGELLKDLFLNLVKLMIGPLVFASIVQGIASGGDLRRVGRIGVKALLYFEIITTLALLTGLLVADLLKPGRGVVLPASKATLEKVAEAQPQTVFETVRHAVPTSVFDALVRGDVLQVVTFSALFGIAITKAGAAGEPLLHWAESLTQVMFKFAGLVMLFAPLGVAGAMLATVARNGAEVLLHLGALVGTLYLAYVIFVVVVLGSVVALAKVPLAPFLRAVREPCLISFATANSESALPKAYEAMERFGVPRAIAGFVLPTGYTFNLDGAAVYLTVAVVFVAQTAASVSGESLGWERQLVMALTLMVASKGVAAIPRASLVVLIAAVQSFGLPVEGAALLVGIDTIRDMGRTTVNVLGNCLASVVVARWEGQFEKSWAWRNFGASPPDTLL